jgi:YesN/AraC family two-component response regulator
MDWIRANYDQHLTVASIAREFDYNPDYLSALFSKTANISLIHFINKTRIDISKSLIVNYDISISEAAYSCGFSDEKYFMKTFKKLENLTPTQYRKAFFKKR